MKTPPSMRPLALGLLAFTLSACTTDRTPPEHLDDPYFKSPTPTPIIVRSDGGPIHIGDLAKAARIVRRYKTLAAAERALVKLAVSRRLEFLTEEEYRRVKERHRAEIQAIKRLPDRAVSEKRLADLQERMRQEAAANVAKSLGALVAVPLKTSDNRSAVAFAKLNPGHPGEVDVVADAGEVDRPIASLFESARVQDERGRVAAYLETKPVAVASGR